MRQLVNFIFLLPVLFITACATDNSDDPISPSIDTRDKTVAYWDVSENSAIAGINSHTVNIIKSTISSSEVLINNFSGLSVSARASINNNILTIPFQQIGTIGFTKGTGTLTGSSSISISYTTSIGTNRDSCSAIYTKQ